MRLVCLLAPLLLLGCQSTSPRSVEQSLASRDLGNGIVMRDTAFYSKALQRQEVYRVVEPAKLSPTQTLHVVYLLHGNGGDYKDWQQSAPLAHYASLGYVFVMPEGHGGYWVNSATRPADKYEDFLTTDLIADSERDLPPGHDRSIAGVSMGGFGALVVALRHPGLYGFVGALSPPVDVPERSFTLRRLSQSMAIRGIFGPYGSSQREARDPFWLVRHCNAKSAPYIYLGAGSETLAEPIARFAKLLQKQGLRYDFQYQQGGHEWKQWDLHLDRMLGEIDHPAPSS